MKVNAQLLALNRGEVSKTVLARIDLEKLRLAAACQLNWMPSVLGPMQLRPGLNAIGEVILDQPCKLLRFVFSKLDTSLLEVTQSGLRIWINDQLLTRPAVSTAVNDGLFSGTPGAWSASNTTGGCSATYGGGQASLNCAAVGGLAQLQQMVTVGNVGVEHALRIVVNYGPVTLRVGSTAGANDLVNNAVLDTGTHSISFTPQSASFVIQLESTDQYAKNLGQCTIEAAGVVRLPTPWLQADLPGLRYDQSGDVVYVACAGYQQYKIERRGSRPGARGWSVVQYRSNDGPFGATNTSPLLMAVSDFYGNPQLSTNRPYFTPAHVGAMFRLFTPGQQNGAVLGAQTAFTPPVRVSGVGQTARNYSWLISGAWVGTLSYQRSLDGPDSGFTTVSQVTVNGTIVSATGGSGGTPDLDNVIAWERVGFESGLYTSGAASVRSTYFGGGAYGICRVTGYTSPTTVLIEVLSPFSSLEATDNWQAGEWSAVAGWPTSVAGHEGRLGWFGSDQLWLSESDNYTGFAAQDSTGTTLGDSGVIDVAMGSGPFDNIPWALSLTRLLIGREQSIASARSSNFDQPLTPTAIVVRDCSDQGANRLPAIKVGKRGIFVQVSGRKVYELAFNGQEMDYGDRDLTRLNLEIGLAGFTAIDKATQPDKMIWLPRGDGQVACLLYDVDDDVVAWWRMQTLGVVEDVAVLPSSAVEESTYFVVNRTINGTTKRFIEKLALRTACVGGAINQQLDCAVTYQGAATSSLQNSFLPHSAIAVWADGAYIGTTTTDSFGTFTMPDDQAHSNVVAGLAGAVVTVSSVAPTSSFSVGTQYNGYPCEVFADIGGDGRIKRVGPLTVSAGTFTMPSGGVATSCVAFLGYVAPFESAKLAYAAEAGTPLNQRKKIDHVGLVLYDTVATGLQFGQRPDVLDNMPAVEGDQTVPATTVWPEYEEPMISLPGEWDTDARLFLLAQAPQPCTVGAVTLGVKTNG